MHSLVELWALLALVLSRRAARNTRYRYSKIAPLGHKMADNCVSLARTNTLSSTITKPLKT